MWKYNKHEPAEKLVPSRAKNGRIVVWYQTNVNLQQDSKINDHTKHNHVYQYMTKKYNNESVHNHAKYFCSNTAGLDKNLTDKFDKQCFSIVRPDSVHSDFRAL